MGVLMASGLVEMRMLLIAVVMCKDAQSNQWPATLAQALPYLAKGETELRTNVDDYIYKRPDSNLDRSMEHEIPVLSEKMHIRTDGAYVGFADGSVKFLKHSLQTQ